MTRPTARVSRAGTIAVVGMMIALAARSVVFPEGVQALPAAASITLSPRVGPPTTAVTVHGSGFGANEGITLRFGHKPVATPTTDGSGRFTATFDVPKGAGPGSHPVKAKGGVSGLRAKATFTARTDWPQFRFDPIHSGANPYENVLTPRNVGNLVVHWRHLLLTSTQSSPAVVGGVVYIGDDSTHLYALDAATGQQRWRFSTSRSPVQAPAVWKGTVYVTSGNGIDAVEASTGKGLWHFNAFDPDPAVVADGAVYVGSFSGGVHSLDAVTGEPRWFFPTGPVAGSPTVAGGSVFVGSDDHNVYAIDASTGTKRWSFTTGGQVRSSPSVSNGVVYVGSEDGHVYALKASTGKKVWAFAIEHQYVDSSPAVAGGAVYVGADQDIYALDAATGTELWSIPILNVNL